MVGITDMTSLGYSDRMISLDRQHTPYHINNECLNLHVKHLNKLIATSSRQGYRYSNANDKIYVQLIRAFHKQAMMPSIWGAYPLS